jgi:Ribulose-phosphate 3 epimerase family
LSKKGLHFLRFAVGGFTDFAAGLFNVRKPCAQRFDTSGRSRSRPLSVSIFVLVMTVNPGFGGQTCVPRMAAEIERREMIDGRFVRLAEDVCTR